MARNEKLLREVKQECLDLGLDDSKILLCSGDITNTADLLRIRSTISEGRLTSADSVFEKWY